MSQPKTWADAANRLRRLLADEASADEWIRLAVEAKYGGDVYSLNRQQRALALQKLAGVVLALEDRADDLAFDPLERDIVNAVFLRFFEVALDGPAWRVQPHEERPSHHDLSSDFGPPPDPAETLTELLQEIAQRPSKKDPLPSSGLGGEGV